MTSHFELRVTAWVPLERSKVFAAFADACNLEVLTPPFLGFSVVTPKPIEMKSGQIIDYRLRLHGLPVRWQTEITCCEPPTRFEDTQVRGPYSHWVHTHTFQDLDGGTLMKDVVRYSVPGGTLIHWLFVKRDLLRIFKYRQKQLPKLLGVNEKLCRLAPVSICRANSDAGESPISLAAASHPASRVPIDRCSD